jgi:hypothetical protein
VILPFTEYKICQLTLSCHCSTTAFAVASLPLTWNTITRKEKKRVTTFDA